jgi:3-dehydroquinate synthase
MVMAAHTAMRLGQFSADDLRRVEALLARANLPVAGPREMAPADYLPHMMRDKKVVSGQLRLVLPQGLGQAEVRADVRNDIVLASIADCQS